MLISYLLPGNCIYKLICFASETPRGMSPRWIVGILSWRWRVYSEQKKYFVICRRNVINAPCSSLNYLHLLASVGRDGSVAKLVLSPQAEEAMTQKDVWQTHTANKHSKSNCVSEGSHASIMWFTLQHVFSAVLHTSFTSVVIFIPWFSPASVYIQWDSGSVISWSRRTEEMLPAQIHSSSHASVSEPNVSLDNNGLFCCHVNPCIVSS